MRLEGKVAMITGAASGIGRAMAFEFAAEGASVVIADTNETGGAEVVDIIRENEGVAEFVRTDVTLAADVEQAVLKAAEVYGVLNILINNAGIMVQGTVVELTEDDWDRVLSVNLKGAFLCSKYAIRQFRHQGTGGAIVNMGSVNSYYAEGGIAATAPARAQSSSLRGPWPSTTAKRGSE